MVIGPSGKWNFQILGEWDFKLSALPRGVAMKNLTFCMKVEKKYFE